MREGELNFLKMGQIGEIQKGQQKVEGCQKRQRSCKKGVMAMFEREKLFKKYMKKIYI